MTVLVYIYIHKAVAQTDGGLASLRVFVLATRTVKFFLTNNNNSNFINCYAVGEPGEHQLIGRFCVLYVSQGATAPPYSIYRGGGGVHLNEENKIRTATQ